MGNSSNSTIQDLVDISTTIIQQTTMNNTVTSNSEQSTNIYANGPILIDNATISQVSTIDVKSLLSGSNINNMSSKIAESIANYAQTKSGSASILNGNTSSDSKTNISTRISNAITMQDTYTIVVKAINSQKVNLFSDSSVTLKNVKIMQTANVVASAIVNSSNVTKVLNDYASKIDQHASSVSEGIDPFGGLGSIGIWIFIFIILVIMSAIGYAYVYLNLST